MWYSPISWSSDQEASRWLWSSCMVLAFCRRGSVIPICLYLLVGRYMKERNSGLRNESSKTKRTGLFLYRYRLLRWFWNSRKEAFKGCALNPIPGEFWKRLIWYKNRLYGLFLIYRYLQKKEKWGDGGLFQGYVISSGFLAGFIGAVGVSVGTTLSCRMK